ncbi:hypothetical protein NQZ68_003186 [Dissostichus eleginoides]|nr:hypothetical protein NQZ68_003186 [Dissostichus eleginoides]
MISSTLAAMLTLVDQDTSPLLWEKAYGEPAFKHSTGFSGRLVALGISEEDAACHCAPMKAPQQWTLHSNHPVTPSPKAWHLSVRGSAVPQGLLKPSTSLSVGLLAAGGCLSETWEAGRSLSATAHLSFQPRFSVYPITVESKRIGPPQNCMFKKNVICLIHLALAKIS